jgi:AcrR family transcriptional regulator
VQPPTIYRLFGSKEGLLDAAAEHGVAAYVAEKISRPRLADPLEDLKASWDLHVEFSLAHPALFAIMAGKLRATPPPALAAADANLRQLVNRLARAGRLAVPEERATQLIHACSRGTVMMLLSLPEAERDPELSATAREAVFAAIALPGEPDEAASPAASAAITLRAGLESLDVLSPGEQLLMAELLDRIAHGEASEPPAKP